MCAKPLSHEELDELLNEGIPKSVRDKVAAEIETCFILCEAIYQRRFTRPSREVEYNLEGRTAGYAHIAENRITLNKNLMNDPRHLEDMLDQTLPHEVAHLIAYQINPRDQAHGRTWRQVMNVLGKEARRCHSYDVEPKFVKSRPFAYKCGCEEPHMVTATINRRILTKTRAYSCRKCGETLRPVDGSVS